MNILIVGSGNIGARHVQSLCLNNEIVLSVLEPSKGSLLKLKSIIGNVAFNNIHYFSSISEIDTIPDLAIIATVAEPRKEILFKLLDLGVKNFLLEKIVCQSTNQYEEILNECSNKNIMAWVNFPRRYLPIYSHLRDKFSSDNEPVRMLVDTGNLGIVCGAIHQLDIFQYITSPERLSVDLDCIRIEMIDTKRPGYKDFSGNITISSNKNDTLLLNFTQDDFWPLIEIYRNSKRYYVIDNDNKFSNYALKKNNWCWNKTNPMACAPLVSEITNQIVSDLIKSNSCKMPTLQESYQTHKLILDLLLNFYKNNFDSTAELLPVT